MATLPDVGRNPDYGLAKQGRFAVLTAKFGDGYEQRMEDGLNSHTRVWNVSWTDLYEDQKDTLKNFLDEQKGVYAFEWTLPDSTTLETVMVVCREPAQVEWAYFEGFNLSATFEEVHNA